MGKVTFGFLYKQQKVVSAPSGNTSFALAGLAFTINSNKRPVVNQSGSDAQFHGNGIVGGTLAPNGNPFKFTFRQLLGVVITMIGYFYLRAARQESMTLLHAWSVHARLGMAVTIIVLVILDLGKPTMLIFAVTELAGSLWTSLALRAEGSKRLGALTTTTRSKPGAR